MGYFNRNSITNLAYILKMLIQNNNFNILINHIFDYLK